MRIPSRMVFILSILFLCINNVYSQETVFQFTEGLSVPLVGSYGREAVFTDHLLYQIVAGENINPVEGEVFTIKSNQDTITWKAVIAGDKQWFKHPNLRGGYLYCSYVAPKAGNFILEANGQSEVFVNGEIRGGDVYAYGWVQHPVRLKKGLNTFLFRVGRGRQQAKLTTPPSKIFLSTRDALLPDIIAGEKSPKLGAVRIINATSKRIIGHRLETQVNGGELSVIDVPDILAFSSRKVPFEIIYKGNESSERLPLNIFLRNSKGKLISQLINEEFKLAVKNNQDKHKVTFISEIDGSVQYYSVVPQSESGTGESALFLSLHGASVEAVSQANAYQKKTWGVLVAPTNRRPYGFDWEDWGRWDAQEVLGLAINKYNPDPARIYLTGHSMGGHGAWQVGVTLPGPWAAIAPSAGWYSFWSYAGKKSAEKPELFEEIIQRSANPSNTLELSRNYLNYGVYILHGDADDNVPVEQARFMRNHLASYHPDFCYYERQGAGHWWGNECVDWPPLFNFFKDHIRPSANEISKLEFVTASPGVSATNRFITIWQQNKALEFSSVKVNQDLKNNILTVLPENVAVLELNLDHLQAAQPVEIHLEGDTIKVIPENQENLYLKKENSVWQVTSKPPLSEKGPDRSGLFKDAFRNRVVFVYGTSGTQAENSWAFNKARFDAETFWYRGNGAIEIIPDVEYESQKYPGRNVILFGHAEMNSAWNLVLENCPIEIKRGSLSLGSDTFEGENLGAYFIYPKKGDSLASVGIIAGSGMEGLRSVIQNRYFVSGSGFPDFLIIKSEMLTKGLDGVLATGFFNNKWGLGKLDYVKR